MSLNLFSCSDLILLKSISLCKSANFFFAIFSSFFGISTIDNWYFNSDTVDSNICLLISFENLSSITYFFISLILVSSCLATMVLPCKPTTAKIRQRSAINSRICLSLEFLFPNIKNSMYRKTVTPCGGINHGFIFLWIEHFYTHINHITRRKILSFFSLATFIY